MCTLWAAISGGSRGGSRGSNEPPLEPKLFHFHGGFQEKLVKLHKSNPSQLIWTPGPKILDPPLSYQPFNFVSRVYFADRRSLGLVEIGRLLGASATGAARSRRASYWKQSAGLEFVIRLVGQKSQNKRMFNQSINQSINQPTNQPTNLPTNQSINQAINQSVSQSLNPIKSIKSIDPSIHPSNPIQSNPIQSNRFDSINRFESNRIKSNQIIQPINRFADLLLNLNLK